MRQETPAKPRPGSAPRPTRADASTLASIIAAVPLLFLSALILLLALQQAQPEPPIEVLASAAEKETVPQLAKSPLPPAKPVLDTPPPLESMPPPPAQQIADIPPPALTASEKSPPAEIPPERPIVEGYSVEAYSLLNDLAAAIDSAAWQDAAEIITSPRAAMATGVAPNPSDKSLLTTLPIAIELAHRAHGQIRAALGERFAALARLRVAEAMEAADASRLSLAAAQFPGTPAAAAAQEWLGDQALAAGSFASALHHYQLANQTDPDRAAQISPRLHLAQALLGQNYEAERADDNVTLGEIQLTASEFAALLGEMKARPATSQPIDEPADIVPGKFTASTANRIQLTAPAATGAKRRSTDSGSANSIALMLSGESFYHTMPSRIQAYAVASGHLLWQFSPDSPPDVVRQPASAPRLLIEGDRVVLRLSAASGASLMCLDRSTGQLLWTTDRSDREWIASDALAVAGQLSVIVVEKTGEQRSTVRYHVVDRRTGRSLLKRDVVELRRDGSELAACELVPSGPHLVAAFSGVTISLDAQGNLRWVRLLPEAVSTHDQPRPTSRRLLVREGQPLFWQEPTAQAILALEAETGRLLWRWALPPGNDVAGIAQDCLVVATPDGLRGLATSDGREKWQTRLPGALPKPLVASRHILIGQTVSQPASAAGPTLQLNWINAASGEPLFATTVTAVESGGAMPRQLLAQHDRLWCYLAGDESDRALWELVPSKQALRKQATFHHARHASHYSRLFSNQVTLP